MSLRIVLHACDHVLIVLAPFYLSLAIVALIQMSFVVLKRCAILVCLAINSQWTFLSFDTRFRVEMTSSHLHVSLQHVHNYTLKEFPHQIFYTIK